MLPLVSSAHESSYIDSDFETWGPQDLTTLIRRSRTLSVTRNPIVLFLDIALLYHNTMHSSRGSIEKSCEDVEIEHANEAGFDSPKAEEQAVEGEIFPGINKETILAFLV